jgi:hypothetical protein
MNTQLLTARAPPVALCGSILCTVEDKVKAANTCVAVSV